MFIVIFLLYFVGFLVNVICNIFINSFGLVIEIIMVSVIMLLVREKCDLIML